MQVPCRQTVPWSGAVVIHRMTTSESDKSREASLSADLRIDPEFGPSEKNLTVGNGVEVRKTICSICNPLSHCGLDAHVKDGRVIRVEGTRENPHNGGTLCPKGAASRQYIYHADRIKTPLVRRGPRGSDQFEPVSWDEALDTIASRLMGFKKSHGPESVIFYAGYSKWMRPFLKRLALGFGSPNYCTESSCCSAAAVLGARLNYGYFGPPEIEKTKTLLVWSSNPFYSNTSKARKLVEARERGMRIIEVGPLVTPFTAYADIHLRIRPGTSGALALALANVIISENLYDREFVENWTVGFDRYKAYAGEFPPEVAEEITGVPAELILRAAKLYAGNGPAGLLTGPNATVHHTNGVQNHRAITALIGLTGNFDREGGNYVVPPSYLYVGNGLRTRQSKFEHCRPWDRMPPRIGQDRYPVWCKMVHEAQAMHLPFQIQSQQPYPIKALLAFGLNHRMWPGSDFMKQSLEKLDFLVDVDLFMTDSARLADVVLPGMQFFRTKRAEVLPGTIRDLDPTCYPAVGRIPSGQRDHFRSGAKNRAQGRTDATGVRAVRGLDSRAHRFGGGAIKAISPGDGARKHSMAALPEV